jgi:hypothetical protein
MAKKEFADTLSGEREVNISFVRSKNGRVRTIPIWFAVEGGTVQLLPMYGLRTKWLQDVEKSGKAELSVKSQKLSASPKVIHDQARVEHIKGNFAKKYGIGDVKSYYPGIDVAVEVEL